MHSDYRCDGILLLIWMFVAGAVHAQPASVPLWTGGAPLAQGLATDDVPTLTAFLPASNPTGTGVVIAPGGGYGILATVKEGDDVARWLNAHGVAGFVLKYRLGPKYHHPVELGDAQRAIRTVRAEAASFGVRADHVGMWGFSAGGHLTATAGTMYDAGLAAGDAIDGVPSRPDFLVLAYPVITLDDPQAHKGSRVNLLGPNADPGLVRALSAQNNVTSKTPQTFLFATTDDETVPVANSVMFYRALVEHGVPVEMHLFAHGPHGVGLAATFPELKGWPDLLASWMRGRGLMAPAP